jgi:hypothetical protein
MAVWSTTESRHAMGAADHFEGEGTGTTSPIKITQTAGLYISRLFF